MVPVLLPKTGHVLFQELEAAHPLGALPEVEVRHEQAGGPAVLRGEPLPIVLQGDQVVRAVQVAERQVRRESLLREDEAVPRVGPYARPLEQELPGTPSNALSSRLQRVTQWMSHPTVVRGSASSSS